MASLNRSFSIGLVVCLVGWSNLAAGQATDDQPPHDRPSHDQPPQWKAAIDRPTRGWDYDGERILGHVGYDICLWDAESGKRIHRMKGHDERIITAQFSPDGHHALTSSWMGPGPMAWYVSKDTSTRLWNLDTGREKRIFKSQLAGEFSPDGRQVITFAHRLEEVAPTSDPADQIRGGNGTGELIHPINRFDKAIVWETHTGRQLAEAELKGNANPDDSTLHFSPDGRRFVYLDRSTAMLFDASEGSEIGSIDVKTIGSRLSARTSGYTSSGALAYVDKKKFQLADMESNRIIQSVSHEPGSGDVFAWTHDGSKVALIGRDKPIQICDLGSGKVIAAERGPHRLQTATVSPDNRRLAILWSGSERDEQVLSLYDMNTGKKLAEEKLPELAGMIGFSPDSKTLVTGGSEFVIFDAEDGKKIRTLKLLDAPDVERWSQ